MTHRTRSDRLIPRIVGWTARAIAAIALLGGVACGHGPEQLSTSAERIAARRLTGTFTLALTMTRPLSLSAASPLPMTVRGPVTMLEMYDQRVGMDGMDGATHAGLYDLPLTKFGMVGRDGGTMPAIIARVVAHASTASAPERDSVYLIVNPETPRNSLRLWGTLDDTGAEGVWQAESAFGGGGTFVLRRVPP